MKLISVVGARPQFIKVAIVAKALKKLGVDSDIIHTGQHFDDSMSDVFFRELNLSSPSINLGINGTLHGKVTGDMLGALEQVYIDQKPDAVLTFGDTNSTLAAALAAAKLHVPIFHVEAGPRSYNRKMPEEINRVLTDHLSELLFCPTLGSVSNLKKEGITEGVYHVGDVMYDAAIEFGSVAEKRSRILETLQLERGNYILVTIHRPENTDDSNRLATIVRALETASEELPVVFPVHPRTMKMMRKYALIPKFKNGGLIDPVGFLDMIRLEKGAGTIFTDSGGVQKEAYFHKVPCITFRQETSWPETVRAGWNQLVGANYEAIFKALSDAGKGDIITEYGDGEAGRLIAERILEWGKERTKNHLDNEVSV